MSISSYFEKKILDHMVRNVAFTPAATLYISLHTSDPGEAYTSGEVTGGAGPYARQSVTVSTGLNAASGSPGFISNVNVISYTGMPACTVTHVAIWDASTSGNMLVSGQLTTSKSVNAGDTFQIAAGDLVFQLN